MWFTLVVLASLCTVALAEESPINLVSSGSVLKLKNTAIGSFLHSHKVNYGSGSGQQSVTGFQDENDANSYWMVQAIDRETKATKPFGVALKRNDLVIIRHMATGQYLHSHEHRSPLSGNQEVSAYAHQDDLNYWEVLPRDTEAWERNSPVRLHHVATNAFLSMTNKQYQNPIPGQFEVAAVKGPGPGTLWQTTLGIFFTDKQID